MTDGAGPVTTGAIEEAAQSRAVSLALRLDRLQQENEALGRELLRCYEQLNLVFDITENIATLHDPETMRAALLRRVADMLGAGALLVDSGGQCAVVDTTESATPPLRFEPACVRACLSHEIELVRQTQHSRAPRGQPGLSSGLGGAHALLAALRQVDAEAAVVIVLRHPNGPAFDSGDVLATEAVLGYGGHILANVVMVRHLRQTAVETVRALANAIDAKDRYTCGHSERVGWLARLMGLALRLPDAQLQVLEWTGILHDVGKIGISDQILNKPGRLTAAERKEIERHSQLSHDVLGPVERFGAVREAVLYHHENWDGSGYPAGLAGEKIPLLARIVRVADMFDALTSTRAYRHGFSLERAMQVLAESAGRGTDPHLTTVFIQAFKTYAREHPGDFRRRFAHIDCAEQEEKRGGNRRQRRDGHHRARAKVEGTRR